VEYLEQVWESIRRFFRVNPGVKLSSLLLAVLLWLYVVASNEYTYQLEVPVQIVNIRSDLTLAREVPSSVTARFRGSGVTYFKTVLSSAYSEFVMRLDARRVEGATDFYLQTYVSNHPDNFITPRGLNLELVEIVRPEVITVALDEEAERTVPIANRITVEPQAGYTMIGSISISPDSVTLEGPASRVEAVDSIVTEERKVALVDDPVNGMVSLHIPDPALLKASVQQVQYQADIQPISERRITDIPVEIVDAPDRLSVTSAPSTVSLTVEGGTEYIFNLEPEEVRVYIEFPEQWKPDESYYVPRVEPPDEVLRWRNMSPSRVEVVVRKR